MIRLSRGIRVLTCGLIFFIEFDCIVPQDKISLISLSVYRSCRVLLLFINKLLCIICDYFVGILFAVWMQHISAVWISLVYTYTKQLVYQHVKSISLFHHLTLNWILTPEISFVSKIFCYSILTCDDEKLTDNRIANSLITANIYKQKKSILVTPICIVMEILIEMLNPMIVL